MKIINYNPRAYPSPTAINGQMILLGVLTEDENGYLKVYEGIVQDNSLVDPGYVQVTDWVARNGNPASLETAKSHFPFLDKNIYRR